MAQLVEAGQPGSTAAAVAISAVLPASSSQSDESIRVLVRVRPNLEREEGSSQAVFVEGGKVCLLDLRRTWAFHESFCRLCTYAPRSKPRSAPSTQLLVQRQPKKMCIHRLETAFTTWFRASMPPCR